MNVTLSSWVASGSQSWLGISLYLPSISSLWNSSTVCVFGCYSPSLSANSFSTSLIVDAICKSFNGLSYLRFASRARPVALLFSVYSNCNSVENKFRTTDFFFFCCVTSYNSVLVTQLLCPCLFLTVLCLIRICTWRIMSTVNAAWIFIFFGGTQITHMTLVFSRGKGIFSLDWLILFMLPNSAWSEVIFMTCLVLSLLGKQ